MKACIKTTSYIETESLGRAVGRLLAGGEVLELVSDVGGGKTTLTKGIVSGAGIGFTVSSPTFTVAKVYEASEFIIHHYDFYRLGELGLMSEELQEVLDRGVDVAVIEWAGSAHDQLPRNRTITITIERSAEGEDIRNFVFDLPDGFVKWAEALELQPC